MSISQKIKNVLMWNFQQIIFIWKRRYCQIFKSALVNLESELIINGKTRKYFLELASLKLSGRFPRKSFNLNKTPFCKAVTLLKWIFLLVISRNLTCSCLLLRQIIFKCIYYSERLPANVFDRDKNASILSFKRLFT